MNSILLVEDDESLNRGISFKLSKEGYKTFAAKTIKEARNIFKSQSIDLCILDIGLPDGSGFDFCGEIRKTSDVLIIFLTACDEEVDIVTGLDMGGDDYITKPFSLTVLISKINALLRRNCSYESKEIVSGDITFDSNNMKLTKNNSEIILTKVEFKLVKYLIENAGHIVTKNQLFSIWDMDSEFIDQNTIAVNIRRLREKIEDDPSNPVYIKNVRGIGYIWSKGCVKR